VISVDDTLIFSIEIPITNGMRFIIYEVIPLMQLTQDQVIIIEAKSAYLAVDKAQKNFISFEEHQLTKCIVLKDTFVAQTNTPSMSMTNCKIASKIFSIVHLVYPVVVTKKFSFRNQRSGTD